MKPVIARVKVGITFIEAISYIAQKSPTILVGYFIDNFLNGCDEGGAILDGIFMRLLGDNRVGLRERF